MLSSAQSAAAGLVTASLALLLGSASALAGQHYRHHGVYWQGPPGPYTPYYYSPWNPYSVYSVYDHLSGGRQLCHLATEPCDNNHRIQN
jgi:hypothetical protein